MSVAPEAVAPPIYRIVPKVFAYILSRGRLLTLECPGDIYNGMQVPAGTVEPGESPVAAVLREAEEETGLAGLEIVSFLGRRQRDMQDYGLQELHDRHFFELRFPGVTEDAWSHIDRNARGGPKRFNLAWRTTAEAQRQLVADHDALMHVLRDDQRRHGPLDPALFQSLGGTHLQTRVSTR